MDVINEIGDYLIVIALVLIIVLIIIVIMQHRQIERLNQRITALSSGTDGENLEDMLVNIFESYSGINTQLENNTADIRDIYQRLHFAIQKVGIVKYDAFKQMGGNLSSVIAVLDQDNNGFLLNTVQNTDGCYSYVKRIQSGRSDVALTDEEQDAMEMALESQRV